MRLVQMGDVATTGTRLSFIAGDSSFIAGDSSKKDSINLKLSSQREWVAPGRNIKVPSRLVATRLDMVWPMSADRSYIRELSDSEKTTPDDIVNALSQIVYRSNQHRVDKTFSYIDPLIHDAEDSSVLEEASIISGIKAKLTGTYLNSNAEEALSSVLARGKLELQIPYEYDGIDTKIHYKILVNSTGDTDVLCYFFDPYTGQRKALQPKNLGLLSDEVESTLESIVNESLATQG